MSAQFWLTILGGFLAAATGYSLSFVQRKNEREEARRGAENEALCEFREALMPLLIELDRWGYQPDAVWVGQSRELPELDTWIFDPKENAQKPQDWNSIGQHGQAVERLWRDRLAARASAPNINALWTEISKLLFHLTREDGSDPRPTAEQAESRIIDMLAAIKKRVA